MPQVDLACEELINLLEGAALGLRVVEESEDAEEEGQAEEDESDISAHVSFVGVDHVWECCRTSVAVIARM